MTGDNNTARGYDADGRPFMKSPWFAGDRALWVIIFTLMILSLFVVYSSTNSMAYARNNDTAHYFMNQLRYIGLGLLVIFVVHRIDYQMYARFASLAFIVALAMQILTFVIGVNRNDAVRALPIGSLTIQPSDFLKVTLVLVLARQLARRQTIINKIDILPRLGGRRAAGHNRTTLLTTTVPLLLPMVMSCALVFPSNLSTAGIIFASCWIMLYMGRAKLGELMRLLVIVTIFGVVMIYVMSALDIARARTWTSRINNFFVTEKVEPGVAQRGDADDQQANNAKIAIASGGLLGKGPGHSTQRARLSHSYSDFAYAFIIEEYGTVGATVVLLLYLWLFFRTITIFRKCGTAFPSLLVLGLGLMIFLQAAVNMLVSTGLFFVTGQNLPLISMGGSSVLFISLALGMILSVSRQMQEQTLDKPKGESLLQ